MLFKGIDLLEKVKVALIATLEGLISLFAIKDLLCTLQGRKRRQRAALRQGGYVPRGDKSFL